MLSNLNEHDKLILKVNLLILLFIGASLFYLLYNSSMETLNLSIPTTEYASDASGTLKEVSTHQVSTI
ncbi:unnamed protein product [Fructobacillus tropaeoli]|nr:unnamed protein product [Fructobacillus tropaeoli]